MPPIDPSPRAGEVMPQPSQPRFPEPQPERPRDDAARAEHERGSADGSEAKTDPVTGAGEDIAG